MKQTAVEWLAEKYNYVTWMRNRDEISAGLADEWRKHYLDQALAMEKEQIKDACNQTDVIGKDHENGNDANRLLAAGLSHKLK
jgi:hypothetical protein